MPATSESRSHGVICLEHRSNVTCDFPVRVEVELEEDGRFIAEVPDIPGALVYGATAKEAILKVEALVLRILADRIDSGEESPELEGVFTVTP